MAKCKFFPHSRDVFYTVWVRRKDETEWKHHGTPDSNHAERLVLNWAKDNPEWEFRLDKKTEIVESAIVSS